ncbi:F5/8 type C domain-containing protein [Parapedobacter composti]|uniref:F5/8 type C domain-containing protein n=1 Tax=Parapedobacter composti TaxID=623281 RepID=A0A1I1EU71_9SPHI|nr:DUF4998 domain-containing protein [Parapedobacter composti]SFB90601.1 F5/8 type C domain-containing protein [Parapedobacter composti]
MKIINIRFNALNVAATALLVMIVSACGKMDETFREFVKGGRIIYAPTPGDSLKVHPGKNRLQLSWPAAPDPKVSEAHIYWNGRQDSLVANIKNPPNDTVKIVIDNLQEGTYLFEIYIYDELGNRSVKTDFIANTYGDQYQQTLLVRPVDEALYEGDSVMAVWGGNPSAQAYYSEISYQDVNGNDRLVRAYADADRSVLKEFEFTEFIQYRTVYLPSPLAIDTFYTDWYTQRVKGPPIELEKTGWIATASSQDAAGNRLASNAIDGNPSTIWVNQLGATPPFTYPHTITVDMGVLHENIEGFVIITRVGNSAARPKTVELLTSEDGEDWQPHGEFDLENNGEKQFITIPTAVKARYFRIIGKSAQSSSENNIALAEVGLYTR